MQVIAAELLRHLHLSDAHARTAPSLSTIHPNGRKTRTRLRQINQHKYRRVFSKLACLDPLETRIGHADDPTP